MTFAEYEEKICGYKLNDWQKKIFDAYTQARKDGKTLTICFGRYNGRAMVKKAIDEFNKNFMGECENMNNSKIRIESDGRVITQIYIDGEKVNRAIKCDFYAEVGKVACIVEKLETDESGKVILENDETVKGIAFELNQDYIISNAKSIIDKSLKSDKSPNSWYYSWQANLAMMIHDNSEIDVDKANEIAKKFLDRLIGDE